MNIPHFLMHFVNINKVKCKNEPALVRFGANYCLLHPKTAREVLHEW